MVPRFTRVRACHPRSFTTYVMEQRTPKQANHVACEKKQHGDLKMLLEYRGVTLTNRMTLRSSQLPRNWRNRHRPATRLQTGHSQA